MVQCPECGSKRIWKDGIRYVKKAQIQRYLCRSCGYRFSNSKVKFNITAQTLKRSNSGKDFSNPNILQTAVSFQPPSEKFTFKDRENIGSHASSNVTITEKPLNRFRVYNRERQVCAQKDAKNLVKVETRQKKAQREGTATASQLQGKIIEYAWKMKKRGQAESTIKSRTYRLSVLVRKGCDLMNPDSFETVLATEPWTPANKRFFVNSYISFTKAFNIP